jgi:hypothetical protein
MTSYFWFTQPCSRNKELSRAGEPLCYGITAIGINAEPVSLIDELDLMHLKGDGHYYEHKLGRDHIHMACLRCGKITEFVSKTFESLKKQLEGDCHFHILVARLEVGGYCSTCRR